MTNEIILAGTNELGQSKLGKVTQKIIKLNNGEINSEKERAALVAQVVNEKMYEPTFKSVAEWSEQFLKISRSTVSRIVAIVNRFTPTAVYTDEYGFEFKIWEQFTMSQMREMYRATDEQIARCNITPDLTIKEIRERLANDNEIIDIPAAEPETKAEEPETDAEQETEPETEEIADNRKIYKCVRITSLITCAISTFKHYITTNDVLLKENNGTYSVYIADKDETEPGL